MSTFTRSLSRESRGVRGATRVNAQVPPPAGIHRRGSHARRAAPGADPVPGLLGVAAGGSLNAELARLAAVTIEANQGEVDLRSMGDFDTPSYNADVQNEEGFPPGAEEF